MHKNYFLSWTCYTKTTTLGSNAIPVSYLSHIYFERNTCQEDKNDKKLYEMLTFLIA